jgi:hypothetical protein
VKRLPVPVLAGLLMPAAARAECLSDGCYDAIGLLVVGGSAALVLFLAGVGFAVFRKTRVAVALIVAAVLMAGYVLVRVG